MSHNGSPAPTCRSLHKLSLGSGSLLASLCAFSHALPFSAHSCPCCPCPPRECHCVCHGGCPRCTQNCDMVRWHDSNGKEWPECCQGHFPKPSRCTPLRVCPLHSIAQSSSLCGFLPGLDTDFGVRRLTGAPFCSLCPVPPCRHAERAVPSFLKPWLLGAVLQFSRMAQHGWLTSGCKVGFERHL